MRQKPKLQQQRNQPQFQPSPNKGIAAKAKMLEAHKLLVDQSNERILAKIQEIKLARQKEAIAEQQKLVKEQQSAIIVLRNMQKQRVRKQKESLKRKPQKSELVKKTLTQKLRTTKKSPLLNFAKGEKKQVLAWLDLERNAAILEKTDKAIAEKLRAKNTALSLSKTSKYEPSSGKVKSAAQVFLNSASSLSDDKINDILGLTGLNDADSDILVLDDPSIIKLENFDEDYEHEDYENYED